MAESSPELVSLERLIQEVNTLRDHLDEHLEEHPSPIIGHYLARLDDLSEGCRRQSERVARAQASAREREERHAEQQDERKYDAHTKAMAAQMGMTPDDFLELQRRRRSEMRGAPGTMTYSEDHKVIR